MHILLGSCVQNRAFYNTICTSEKELDYFMIYTHSMMDTKVALQYVSYEIVKERKEGDVQYVING